MDVPWQAVALVALIGLGGVGIPDAAAPTHDAMSFQVFHTRSDQEDRDFREVFTVHDVSPGLGVSTAVVEIRRDGLPLPVDWVDADGWLSDGDTFSFVQPAFDAQQVLTGHVGHRQLMMCRYGGGAGMGFTPDEWLAMGLPEEVRCLDELSDM